MKKNILIALSTIALIISCKSNSDVTVNKPLTTNVPSADKTVREGTPLSQWNAGKTYANEETTSLQQDNTGISLLDRLYLTTWYQSEEEYDDGRLETEETFVFFDANSRKSTREYENGRLDDTDYSTVTKRKDITTENDDPKYTLNAVIVEVTERGDRDFEGYYLTDDRTILYIVEEDKEEEARDKLTELIKAVKAGKAREYAENRYLLSMQAR